ncbi:hypothetical protein ACFX2I_046848 [Malus domestica]
MEVQGEHHRSKFITTKATPTLCSCFPQCRVNRSYRGRQGGSGVTIKAAAIVNQIFYLQVWYGNPVLREWLKEHADASQLDKLKWMYYVIDKSPWSSLDENEAFLTIADSAIKLLPEATRPVTGWKGLE